MTDQFVPAELPPIGVEDVNNAVTFLHGFAKNVGNEAIRHTVAATTLDIINRYSRDSRPQPPEESLAALSPDTLGRLGWLIKACDLTQSLPLVRERRNAAFIEELAERSDTQAHLRSLWEKAIDDGDWSQAADYAELVAS